MNRPPSPRRWRAIFCSLLRNAPEDSRWLVKVQATHGASATTQIPPTAVGGSLKTSLPQKPADANTTDSSRWIIKVQPTQKPADANTTDSSRWIIKVQPTQKPADANTTDSSRWIIKVQPTKRPLRLHECHRRQSVDA